MPSSANSSEVDLSDFATQFVPQDGDSDILWEVIEITAERGNKYKVRWAGVDPKTKRPWPQEWVAKHDCTPDIVAAWKQKRAKQKKAKEKVKEKVKGRKAARTKSRTSSVSKISVQTLISSSVTPTRSSATVASPSHDSRATERSSDSRATSISKLRPAEKNGKRKRSPDPSEDEVEDATRMKARATKKRRVQVRRSVSHPSREQSSEAGKNLKYGKAIVNDEGWDADAEVVKSKASDLDDEELEKKDEEGGEESKGEDDDQPLHAVITKIGPPRRASRMSDKLIYDAASVSKPSTSKDIFTNVAPRASNGKVSSLPSKRKSKAKLRSKESVESDPAFEGNREPRSSLPTFEIPHEPELRSPALSPGATARLAAFDAIELHVKEDLPRLSPHPVDDSHDYIDCIHDECGDSNHNDDSVVNSVPPKVLPSVSKHPESLLASRHRPYPITAALPSGNNSYRTGIVPETETESSTNNTQSQPHHPPSSPPRLPATPPLLQIPRTPPRSLVKSRMKPKTPGSSSNIFPLLQLDTTQGSGAGSKVKHLQRIPDVSPSIFFPHLPSTHTSEPVASESMIETALEPEVECPLSSIEQFSSPERGSTRARRGGHEDVDRVIRKRGQELADITLQRKQDTRPKIVARKTARRIWGNPSAKETGKRKKDSETQANSPSRLAMLRPHINDTLPTGSDVGSYSTRKDSELPHINDVANISESQPEDAMIMQQTEDQYVDLDGGGGIDDGSGVAQSVGLLENVDPRVFLRQEEEESTQDLVAEREVRMALDVGLVGDVADIPDVVSSSEEVSSREEVSQQAEGVMENSSSHGQKNSADEDQPVFKAEESSMGKGRSCSRSVSTHQTIEAAKKLQPELDLAVTGHSLSDLKTRPHEHPTESHSHPAPTLHDEDKIRSEEMLQSERDKADALAKEIASLRDALAEASAAAKSNIDLEQQLAEMRNQREQDKMVWDAERSALVSSLHTATGAKASAEADRDFFREQYAQASGYVSSVRVENQQLEMRAAIAEKQATDGVGMIRNTFQERLRNLEGEIRKYKNLAALLTEKDKRTGDELRRRAGEEPELRLRCGKLEDKTQRLIAEKAVLESRLEDAEGEHRALEQKLRGWREEIVKVDAEMRTYKAKMEALVVVAGAEGEDDFSYRCEWRVGKNISCESIFDDNLALQRHLLQDHLC